MRMSAQTSKNIGESNSIQIIIQKSKAPWVYNLQHNF